MRNFNFVGFLVGRIKEVFLFCQRQKLFVRRTRAYLSYRMGGRAFCFLTKYKITKSKVGVGKEKLKFGDRKSTRLNSSHIPLSRMPSSA